MAKQKKAPKEELEQESPSQEQSVKMRFSEDKFYDDQSKPKYEAGKIYDIEGADQIQRWLKRGGEIVEGEFKGVPADPRNDFPAHPQSTLASPSAPAPQRKRHSEIKNLKGQDEEVEEIDSDADLEEDSDLSDEDLLEEGTSEEQDLLDDESK